MEPYIYNSNYPESCFFDFFSKITNSNFEGENKVFKFARINKTFLGIKTTVGDFAVIECSKLKNSVQIQRYNHILQSEIDDNSYTGMNTVIMHSTIKKFCSISWGVTIGPSNHDYRKLTSHSFLYDNFYGFKEEAANIFHERFINECIVGNDVWIGCNSTILRGVTIGDGAVVGANSLVNKDVPPYAIVVGNPAKIIKFRFSQDIIEESLKIKWWDFPKEIIKEYLPLFQRELNIDILEKLALIKEGL
jgi:acetyltransferase-like isoleucine patch superfamily enzyme